MDSLQMLILLIFSSSASAFYPPNWNFLIDSMSYINPLHPPVLPINQSSSYSLSSAVQGGHAPSQFISPSRRRLPQPPYTATSKWNASMGRTNHVHRPISFDYIGYSKQGVPMRELSSRGAHALSSMIHGANDQVFNNTGLHRITFRILWPGYPHVEWARSVEVVTSHGPMTRAQLGATVAMNFARFVEKTQYERASSAEWHLGPAGIRYEHLILISLWNVFEDSWQADVAVDIR